MNPLLIFKLAGIAAIAVMAATIWIKIKHISELEIMVENQNATIRTLNTANQTMLTTIEDCENVNALNSAKVLAAQTRAHEAEVRLAAVRASADAEIESIEQRIIDLRATNNDQTCRLLTDRLPDFLFD